MSLTNDQVIAWLENNMNGKILKLDEAVMQDAIRKAKSPAEKQAAEQYKKEALEVMDALRNATCSAALKKTKGWTTTVCYDKTIEINFGETAQAAKKQQVKYEAKKKNGDGTCHTYRPVPFINDIVAILRHKNPHPIWFVGDTGTGKTECVNHLVKAGVVKPEGYVKYQINCHEDMNPSSFFGNQTVKIDAATKQNFMTYQEGIIPKWMQQGLDEKGNVIPGAPAGLLFIDEAGALPPGVGIMLNRLLDSGTGGERMAISLELDGGREVKAHPGARVIFAANTNGGGADGMAGMMYAAQRDSIDVSTRKRVSATFRFGWDRIAERGILEEKIGIGDDRTKDQVAKILTFRDGYRTARKKSENGLVTPFTTRDVVKIADLVNTFNELGTDTGDQVVAKAIYYSIFEMLPTSERTAANEIGNAKLGMDIQSMMSVVGDYDY